MRPKLLYKISLAVAAMALAFLLAANSAFAQGSSFTYQGRLTDGGTVANGLYDLQFALFDSASSGAQIGSTQTLNSVLVSAGVFSVTLDFGANSFNGANRFLEISARLSGAGSFNLLTPRQQVTATPYAIRSVNASSADTATTAINATTATNATQLGGVAASQYVQTSDSRLSDARPPTPGSANYIQTNSSSAQNANFNISGNGTAAGTLSGNIVNATTQFNIRGNRVFSVIDDPKFLNSNTFAGVGAGVANTTGGFNSFFGLSAGSANSSGVGNSIFGAFAGASNTTGSLNSFFGKEAGFKTTGKGNSVVGFDSGNSNTTGNDNVFVGDFAGSFNTTGSSNVFIGGFADVTGNGSGFETGTNNTTGSHNTLIGSGADVSTDGLTNANAIGYLAQVGQSNSLVLGSINGVNGATADTNVGIGTPVPLKRLEVKTTAVADGINLAGTAPAFFLSDAGKNEKAALAFAGSAGLYSTDAAAGDIVLRTNSGRLLLQHGTAGAGLILNSSGGTVSIPSLGSGGTATVCRNSVNAGELAFCSSSLRYKTNVATFLSGLDVINRLRPISFTWKQDGVKDIGLGAEEVEKVEPLLTFRNAKGEIEGVKYNQLSAVFINAFKEQQAQIELQQTRNEAQQLQIKRQQAQIEKQQRALDALKSLVCRSHSR